MSSVSVRKTKFDLEARKKNFEVESRKYNIKLSVRSEVEILGSYGTSYNRDYK